MSVPEQQKPQDPTADYRPYPKGPNFLLIVLMACGVMLVVLIAAVFLVGDKGRQLIPHKPTATPNSLVQPLLPTVAQTWHA
jgi:hypothetical protein